MTTKQVQLRRGSDDDHDSFTGAIGELTYVSDTKELRIHDGSLAGGHRVVPDTVVNVKSYGAQGDGTTDDTVAIQAAITAVVTAGTYSIYLPAGVYIVTGALTWPEDNDGGDNYAPSMYGDGAADIGSHLTGTVIQHEPTTSTHCIVDNPGRLNVRDLSIIGNSSTGNPTDGSNVGILIGNGGEVNAGGSGALIERVFVHGCQLGISIPYNGPDGVSINNSTLHKNGTGLFIGGSTNAVTVVGTRISNDSDTDFAEYGVRIGDDTSGSKPVTATFIGCNIERSSVLQVDLVEAICATFIGCYFEGGRYDGQSSQIMRIGRDANSAWSRSITIQGCYFNGLHEVIIDEVDTGNQDDESWLIEFGQVNRVKDLTLINNVYWNSNQGFIKISGVGDFASNSVVSLMNGNNDDTGLPLSDDDSKFTMILAGDGSYEDGVTFNRDVTLGDTAVAGTLDVTGNTTLTAILLTEKSADPDDPAEGSTVIWMSDGTEEGEDGDIMVKITAGATTNTFTLVDFDA